MKNNWFLLVALLLVFAGCRKDKDEIIIENEQMDPPLTVEMVNSNLVGTVVNEAGDAIEGAVVRLGNLQRLTDENGIFTFQNATVDGNGAYLQVEASGYFPGSRTTTARNNTTSQVRIQLLERAIIGTFSSTVGGTVTLSEGGQIDFSSNGVVDQNGNAYSGEVEVAANWLNPADPGFQDQMPGDMRAVNENEETVLLVSMGMMAVELQTPSGDPLQISEPATLTIPVPADMVGDAPSTIPLWYFDENMGIWIEEGQATLQGNEYVGVVNHFTFWNCDVPYPLIQLDGQVLFNDKPLEGYTVTIEIVSSPGETAGTITDSDGFFGGLVPADELLIISVLNVCGEILYTEQIGPFSDDVVLDSINISGSVGFFLAEVEGTLVNCENEPVQNGYVIVDAGAFSSVSAANNGEFSSIFPVCDATEVTVTGLDVDAEKSSDPVTAPISTNIDFGALQACDNDLVPPYYVVNIGTRNFVILNTPSSEPITPAIQNMGSQGQNTPITVLMVDYEFVDQDGNEVFLAYQIEIPTQNVLLDIPQAYVSLFYVDPTIGGEFFIFGTDIADFNDLDITEYAAGIVGGSFDLDILSDLTGDTINFKADFRVPLN